MAQGTAEPPTPVLPDEYQQVTYIYTANKSNAYIPTEVQVKDVSKVVMDYKPVTSGDNLPAFSFYNTSGSKWGYGYTTNPAQSALNCAFTCSPTCATGDSVRDTYTFTKKSGYSTITDYINAIGTPSSPSGGTKGRGGTFRLVQMYNSSNQLVFNAIPVYRISDTKIGLYDWIAQKFYASSGTWSKGSDVT